MKGLKKAGLILMIIPLILVSLYTTGWADENWSKDDPVRDEWNMMDLVLARPIGVAAAIFGTGVFIISLPFTIPTGSVEDAAQMLVVKPFSFSFERKFPDDNI